MNSIAYPNAQSAALAVAEWANRHAARGGFTARRWNKFDPVAGLWYLVPSTEWPSYRFSKFGLGPGAAEHTLRCALYVEKGLDPALRSVYPHGAKYIMGPDWAWHRVMAAMVEGALDGACEAVAAHSGEAPSLWIEAGYQADPAPQTTLGAHRRLLLWSGDAGLRSFGVSVGAVGVK
jgi:hypothetical protein